MATHEAPMSDRHIPEIVNTTLRRGKFGGYERARSLEGRRFKEERVKEETIITREELDHEVLGHVTAAMPSETAALFMATTALEGEQSLLSFRDGLHERGVDTSQGPFIYRILMNDIERLEGMGFVRPIDSREGAVKTMVPTELGEGLGAIYAGYALSLSEKHGKRLEDVWGKYSSQEREAQIVATEEGVIEYRRRPSEVRVRTIEGIIDAWFVNKIPMGLHQLKRFVDKHEAVPEAQIQRAVKAFARAQLLDYTSIASVTRFGSMPAVETIEPVSRYSSDEVLT